MIQAIDNQCAIVQIPEHLSAPIEQDYEHALSTHMAPMVSGRNRPAYWYSPFTGEIISPTGRARCKTGADTTLQTVLEMVERHYHNHYENKHAVTLYLISGRDVKDRPTWQWLEDVSE